jgi:hypothetical protein
MARTCRSIERGFVPLGGKGGFAAVDSPPAKGVQPRKATQLRFAATPYIIHSFVN